ncbi:TPA: MBL fold metallo-hydrolase [Candidatus Poribacteria bacterium]|nr:MBL fold metallo-hydrolase [Candidatus Poribacteria bacterium]
MEKITENIYVETGYPGTNVGLIITDSGSVMLESPYMPEDALDFAEKIKSVSDKEIVYLINTDHHFDHVATNGFFTQNIILNELSVGPLEIARISAQERAKEILAGDGPQTLKDAIQKMDVPRPHIIFSDELSLNMGNLTIHVVHTGGHAVGTSFIYIPEEKVVFCGDNVVSTRFPYLGQGVYRTWAAALVRIIHLDVDYVIPGHERVCDKEPAHKLLKFMGDLQENAEKLFYEVHEKHKVPQSDSDLAKFFPGIEGWPNPAEQAMAEAVRRMYEQFSAQSASF